MKISYNWLKDYIKFDNSSEEISDILTNTGLEVEKCSPRFKDVDSFKKLIIGKITSIQPHPNADKLKLTKVDIGTNVLNIICGANNIKKHDFVVVAICGVTLINLDGEILNIKKTKIRGEFSEGMLCSEFEIGLGYSNSGVITLSKKNDIKVGQLVWDYFDLKQDYIYEIGLTPNRTDAFGHIGCARDILAVLNLSKNKTKLNIPELKFKVDNNDLPFSISIDTPKLCPRYCAITLQNVQIEESPYWLKQKLISIGVKPINNIVDITNFVLFETGSPLHAFDYDKIDSKSIFVGNQTNFSKFTKLTGGNIDLHNDDLLIYDKKEPLCLAGVIGGSSSSISSQTKNIFLESAFFSPNTIRKTSKRHGVLTDSSYRYERGVDIDNCLFALKRASTLIKMITNANISSDIYDYYENKNNHINIISFSHSRLTKLLGYEIDLLKTKDILTDLGFDIISLNKKSEFKLKVPNYRYDVTREIDVFEEVLRIYGYNNIPKSNKVSFPLNSSVSSYKNYDLKNKVSDSLRNSSFFEIKNNSLVSYDLLKKINTDNNLVKILNASSNDLNVLRNNLFLGGLESIKYNLNRQNKNLRFFEFGNIYFSENENYIQKMKLALFLCGNSSSESWVGKTYKMDIFWAKGFVMKLFKHINIELNSEIKNDSIWGEYLSFFSSENEIVSLKNIPLNILNLFGIKDNVVFVDFNWEEFVKYSDSDKIRFTQIPKFPRVRRDLSLLIDKDILFEDLRREAFNYSKKLLRDVVIFDSFYSKELGDKKSYALGFIFQNPSKTLTDKVVNLEIKKIFMALKDKFNVDLRDGELP